MKTQSPDTSLDAELVLIEMIRKAPVSKRFAFVQAWTASMLEREVSMSSICIHRPAIKK